MRETLHGEKNFCKIPRVRKEVRKAKRKQMWTVWLVAGCGFDMIKCVIQDFITEEAGLIFLN